MDKDIMSPEEFIWLPEIYKQAAREHWTNMQWMKAYSDYVLSKQPKKEIVLPEYMERPDWDYGCANAYNEAIDEVKRLNDIQ